MSLRIIFFLLLLIGKSFVFSQEKVSGHEAELLFPFFQTLLKHTESGYVLYGIKPICIDSFSEETCCSGLLDWHQTSVSLWGAKKILESSLFHSKNIIIHIDEKEKLFYVINRRLFLDTIHSSLPLFQYVLGPTVTPESLLEAILSPDQSFFSVLHDDRVLIGIALGYGVQNSLFESRLENIGDARLSADVPPYCAKIHLCSDDFQKKMFLFLSTAQADKVTKNKIDLQPSFGFSSLKEEEEDLGNKVQISSDHLDQELPSFVFGCLKNNEENKKLICALEAAQNKIQGLLQSPTFLEEVLEKIAEEKVEIEKTEFHTFFSAPNGNFNAIVAKTLKSNLEGYSKEDIYYFSKGLLEDAEDGLTHEQWLLGFPECIRNIRNARENLEVADHFFSALQKDSSFTPVLDNYLFYKIVKRGAGRPLNKETKVCLDFDIFAPSGKCLSAKSKFVLDLEKTIPGFAHGIQGMQRGEKREIYIHPALAYGVHTYLEKGIYLKAIVELVTVHDSKGELPSLIPMDLAFIRNDQFQQECEETYKQCMLCSGSAGSQFLKAWPGVDIKSVADALQSLNDNDVLSHEETDALNQYFWNLYFSKNKALITR